MTIRDLENYQIIEEKELCDIGAYGTVLRHKKSGARIALIQNDDTNKVFYVAFRTPPEDETGVPHIIEHTVLCGSEKYPLKDPFVELVKGSLNTFLNAMTYPDKTVYPIASYNDQDFRNLMDVYLDAVFHPNIVHYEEIFKQEGWHYELEDAASPITINGVVYNEMKGAYSSPEEVLQNEVFRSLFPDNTYSRNSGGNPARIPELTYEAYLDFYRKHYHPSNSYILMYGDMDVIERLNYLDEAYLSHYDLLEMDTEIKLQEAFAQPAETSCTYSVAEDDPTEDATYLSYNRVIGTSLDIELCEAFDMIDYALVSAPGAPIKEALLEAGIGDDVYGSLEAGIRQPVFGIIAKNANPEDKERFEQIIREKLQEAVEQGIHEESLLAAVNSQEFRFREADFGRYPKGLVWGLSCLDTWLFDDAKVFDSLASIPVYEALRSRIGSGYYEKLVEEYLLNNTHGSLVCVLPQQGKADAEEEALRKKLDEKKASLSEEEIAALVESTAALRRYQEEPSREEDLAKIPLLTREDIRREVAPFENTEDTLAGVPVIRHEIESAGIHYISLLFDAEDTAVEDLAYLSILTQVLSLINTDEHSYLQLSNEINIYTGGIDFGIDFTPIYGEKDRFLMKFMADIKVLPENLSKALALTEEILLHSQLDDVKRLREIIAQNKARLQSSLSGHGNSVAATRGSAGFSVRALYGDRMHGVEFYRETCRMEELLKKEPEAVCSKLKELCTKLLQKSRLMVSYTGKTPLYEQAKDAMENFLAKLPEGTPCGDRPAVTLTRRNQAFVDASTIVYTAICGNFAEQNIAYDANIRLLRMILNFDYLWMNVRVLGGAYGVSNSYLRSGDSYYVSYRDPHIRETLEVFKGVPEYVRNFEADEHDMTKYIIGTFGALDTPLNADDRGRRSLSAYLGKVPFEVLQKERIRLLEATAEDVRALSSMIDAVFADPVICVVGSESIIRENADLFDSIEKLCPSYTD